MYFLFLQTVGYLFSSLDLIGETPAGSLNPEGRSCGPIITICGKGEEPASASHWESAEC